jgi:transposase
MQQGVVTVGLDLAKNVFQVHAIDAEGKVLIRRQLRRSEVLKFFAGLASCLVGMEACASAHHWGRELMRLGHKVRLMPPAYVKPYPKRGKTDAADAEAICEAVTRPTMRFVAVNTPEQQAVLMLHKTRDLLVRQRTGLINALRAHLAEYGIISSEGPGGHGVDEGAARSTGAAAGACTLGAPHNWGTASGFGKRDQSARSADSRPAPYRRCEPPTGDHPGHRTDHCLGDCRGGAGRRDVPIRAAVRGLAWSHAAPAKLRRQGTAWRH